MEMPWQRIPKVNKLQIYDLKSRKVGCMTSSALLKILLPALLLSCLVVPGACQMEAYKYLNCGGSIRFSDHVTGLIWDVDYHNVPTGTSYAFTSPSTQVPGGSERPELDTLRYFDNQLVKNCYSLPVTPNTAYLLRATFFYGWYDNATKLPSFQMTVDVTIVANVTITNAFTTYDLEYYIWSQNSNTTYLCLSRDSSGSVPFISAISLRLVGDAGSIPFYYYSSNYTRVQTRVNCGGPTLLRYPNDTYDRYWWSPTTPENSTLLQTTTPVLYLNTSHNISLAGSLDDPTFPDKVLQTAVTTIANMTIYVHADPGTTAYLALYFAELDPAATSTSREFFIEGGSEGGPQGYNPYEENPSNYPAQWVGLQPQAYYANDFWIDLSTGPHKIVMYPDPDRTSTMGPLLNAMVVYEILNAPVASRILESDGLAIDDIKSNFNLSEWSGDPCLPYPYPWVNCSIVGPDSNPQIAAIDLSGYNLTGTIPSSIINLQSLRTLNLSNNLLNQGSFPSQSSAFKPSFLVLDLSNNNFGPGPIIPDWIMNFTDSLQNLSLARNSFFGELPINILNRFTKLQHLNLDNNKIYGSIDIGLLSSEFAFCGARGLHLSIANNNITNIYYNGTLRNMFTTFNLEGNPYCNNNTPSSNLKRCVCEQYCYDTGSLQDQVHQLQVKITIGASIGGFLLALMILIFTSLFWMTKREKKLLIIEVKKKFDEFEVKPTLFTYNELQIATQDFHSSMKLGEGSYGSVYKGILSNGDEVAVKQLFSSNQQSIDEFLNEIVLVAAMRHRNLVKLKGCCLRQHKRLLVYEYVDNHDLSWNLLECRGNPIMTWPVRMNIIMGVAHGIHYLHALAQPRIIHRDIKASNILLDNNLQAKIADFGLALMFPDDKSHITTIHIAGTRGYLAPEYATSGQLSEKVDIYSFGVLVLEIVSGRRNIDTSLPLDQVYLLNWAWRLHEENNAMNIVDSALGLHNAEEVAVKTVINIALMCVQTAMEARPTMACVVAMLQGETIPNYPQNRSQLRDRQEGLYFHLEEATSSELEFSSINKV